MAKFSTKFRRSYASEEIDAEPFVPTKPRYSQREEVFRCRHCQRLVCPLPSGGQHRNHCPFCLHSRHVDDRVPGDRASPCGTKMAPLGAFQRQDGEHVIVHRCLACGIERFNRIAADDDFDLVLALPCVPPRTSRTAKMGEWEM